MNYLFYKECFAPSPGWVTAGWFKFERSHALRIIFHSISVYSASVDLGFMSNGRIFNVVGYKVGSAHEHHMKRKIVRRAEKKLIPTD